MPQIMMTSVSSIADNARTQIMVEGGTISGNEGNYQVILPDGSDIGPTTNVNVGEANQSSVLTWVLPSGRTLTYSTDWQGQLLALV